MSELVALEPSSGQTLSLGAPAGEALRSLGVSSSVMVNALGTTAGEVDVVVDAIQGTIATVMVTVVNST